MKKYYICNETNKGTRYKINTQYINIKNKSDRINNINNINKNINENISNIKNNIDVTKTINHPYVIKNNINKNINKNISNIKNNIDVTKTINHPHVIKNNINDISKGYVTLDKKYNYSIDKSSHDDKIQNLINNGWYIIEPLKLSNLNIEII